MKQGICKLCLETKSLLKKSHIIPSFMYKGMFDQQHKIRYVSKSQVTNPKLISDGLYEPNILCKDCDTVLINRLETYMSIMLYGGNPGRTKIPVFEKKENQHGDRTITIRNLDYTKAKLFLLSILWRTHISVLPFFRSVNLGPVADRIRRMILTGDAGDITDFESFLVFVNRNTRRPVNSILEPRVIKKNNNTSYVLYINGMIYNFNVSQVNKNPLYEKGHITQEGDMRVLMLDGNMAEAFIDKLFY